MEIKWKGALPHNIEVREKGGVVYLSYPALEEIGRASCRERV